MSFAQQAALGARMAQGWLDTYQQARTQRDMDAVKDARPEQSEGFTPADAEQLAAIANAKDAQGNPYYTLDAQPGGAYGLRSNFRLANAEGQMTTPAPVTGLMTPRRVTDFLGQRYEGDMTPAQIDNARARGYADAVSRTDPVRGLQMRQSVRAGEREEAKFAQDQAMAPLRQRTAELQVSGAERGERAGVRADEIRDLADEVAKMPLEAVEAYASKLNTNTSNIPALFVGKTDKGYEFVTTDPETGKPTGDRFKMNEAQLRQLATASVLGMKGYGAESLQMLAGVNKDMADYIDKWNRTAAAAVTSGNDARAKGADEKYKEDKLKIDQQEANDRGEYYRGMVSAANTRAERAGAGAGGGAGGKIQALLMEQAKQAAAQGLWGGKVESAYEALKRGYLRNEGRSEWGQIEFSLRKAGKSPEEIRAQKFDHWASRGMAPPEAIKALQSGVNDEGKPLTQKDFLEWEQKFPNTPLEDVFGGRMPTLPEKQGRKFAPMPSKTALPERGIPGAVSPLSPATAQRYKAAAGGLPTTQR